MMADEGFREAVAQLPLRESGRDRWTSRVAFWTAVRYGLGHGPVPGWTEAEERWVALWAIAEREHLPPIPGAPDVGASPSVAAAERGLAQMRAIVGQGKRSKTR